jgi:hypothetical protein
MYYKFTLEKLDPEMNTFQKTQVMVTQEMVEDVSLEFEFDVLKLTANDLVDRFRHEFKKYTLYDESIVTIATNTSSPILTFNTKDE